VPRSSDSPTAERIGWSAGDIARRAYADLEAGQYVNLGIGLPTMLLDVADGEGRAIMFHSENGILGLTSLGSDTDPDPDLIDAGKRPSSLVPGGSFFSHAESFAMIRGGHIDVAVLGAFEVAVNGDFANWSPVVDPMSKELTPEWQLPGVGGAVDLAMGAKQVFVLLRAIERKGISRLVSRCRLPLTGRRSVDRVYGDLGVFEPDGESFRAVELAPGVDEDHVRGVFERAGTPLVLG
jgi:3-oxoadipate CoA-transferase, beta subunit